MTDFPYLTEKLFLSTIGFYIVMKILFKLPRRFNPRNDMMSGFRQKTFLDEEFGNLNGVGCCTFAEIVSHTPEIESVLD